LISPDDVSCIIEPYDIGVDAARGIKGAVSAVLIKEAMYWGVITITPIKSGDLSRVVDVRGIGLDGTRNVESGVTTVAIQESVIGSINVSVIADDFSRVVDASQFGTMATGRVDGSVGAVRIKKSVFGGGAIVEIIPNDLTLGVNVSRSCL
jgi:hypothetical protein